MSFFYRNNVTNCVKKQLFSTFGWIERGLYGLCIGLFLSAISFSYCIAQFVTSDQPMQSASGDNRQFDVRMLNLAKIDISTIPLSYAIKRVHGKGERTLYFFTDIDCPFCVKLENILKEIDNVTVYTFMLPLPKIHPDGPRKSTLIWCSESPAQAWNTFHNYGGLPLAPSNICTPPLVEIRTLATKLGIGEEPAVIFANGYMAAGEPFIYATWNAQILNALLDMHR